MSLENVILTYIYIFNALLIIYIWELHILKTNKLGKKSKTKTVSALNSFYFINSFDKYITFDNVH